MASESTGRDMALMSTNLQRYLWDEGHISQSGDAKPEQLILTPTEALIAPADGTNAFSPKERLAKSYSPSAEERHLPSVSCHGNGGMTRTSAQHMALSEIDPRAHGRYRIRVP